MPGVLNYPQTNCWSCGHSDSSGL